MQLPFFATQPALELPTRVLTLYQPWAWLVIRGHKPIENRPPGVIPKGFRGGFWIHAGLKKSPDEWHDADALARKNGFNGLPGIEDPVFEFGKILGRVRVAGVLPKPALCELPDRWRMPQKLGYLLEDPVPLKSPVACRGFQGFWTAPPDVMLAISEDQP